MGGLFKKKKSKRPVDTDAVDEARRRESLTERNRRGAGGTTLTGPSGISGDPTIGTRTLLGGL